MKRRLLTWLGDQLIGRVAMRRPPDFVVGADHPEGPYLLRWYLTPWRAWYRHVDEDKRTGWQRLVIQVSRILPNLYLHRFMRDDDDRALHDHPSFAVSAILRTGYIEHTIDAGGIHRRREYDPGSVRFMRTTHTHRIELHPGPVCPQPCWTLFMFGPTVREWGFHCPEQGWIHWTKFTNANNPGEVGPGCDG